MNSEAILDLFRIIILVFVLSGCIRLLFRRKNMAFVVFFTLGIACILLSDCYWLAYDLLRPDSRMPFAANEICEWAFFLLLGSAISSRYSKEYFRWKKEIVAVLLFVTGNVALWIGWSGEWLQDILTGVAFACFLCALVNQIKQEGILDGGWGILLTVAGFVLILGQAGTLLEVIPEPVRKILDYSCYFLMFALLVTFMIRTVLSFGEKKYSRTMCFSFLCFAWNVVTMYMSGDIFFLAAMCLSMVSFLLMYVALKREVTAE